MTPEEILERAAARNTLPAIIEAAEAAWPEAEAWAAQAWAAQAWAAEEKLDYFADELLMLLRGLNNECTV